MHNDNKTAQHITIHRLIILMVLLCLFVFSLIFYKERVAFSDAANYFERIIRDETFAFGHNRYIQCFAELPAIIAVKLRLSMRVAVMAYSIGMILIPVICTLLTLFWLRNVRLSYAILLFYTITNAQLFYYSVTEYQMGLCLFILYTGVYEHYQQKKLGLAGFFIWTFLLINVIIFSHPLSFLVVGLWCFWQLIMIRKIREAALPVAFGITAASWYVFKKIFFYSPLEEGRKDGIKNFIGLKLRTLYESNLGAGYIDKLVNDYWLLPLIISLTIAGMIYMKKWLPLIYYVLLIPALWLLVTVTFKDNIYDYYHEHLYQTMEIFIVLFFVCYGFTMLRKPVLLPGLALLIFTVSFCKIASGRRTIHERWQRYDNYLSLMRRHGIQKAILSKDYGFSPEDKSYGYFPVTYETMILTSLKGPEHTQALHLVWNANELPEHERAELGDRLFYDGGNHLIADYPKEYFRLDTKPWIVIDHAFPAAELEQRHHIR